MWLIILKYIAKFAVSTGLIDKARGWLRMKIFGSAKKAELKAINYFKKIDRQVSDVVKELGK